MGWRAGRGQSTAVPRPRGFLRGKKGSAFAEGCKRPWYFADLECSLLRINLVRLSFLTITDIPE
jgi:hypothetical protein